MTHDPVRAVDAQHPVTDEAAAPSAPETPVAPSAASPLAAGEKPSLWRVVKDQRKSLWVALVLVVASFWILGQLDRWTLGLSISIGVLLGVVNHLATELWLLRLISSGDQPTRNRMIAATLVRLGVLTVVAVGIAIAFWPDGVGLLLGLAVYRLISLAMTSVTLLKELKSQ
jgi:hypothetical protein